MPILQLYQLTKQNELLEKAIKICDTYTRFQKADGSFSMHENSNSVNLHTQCYALEGLLYAYDVTKNLNYLKSCEKALEWSAQKIEIDGSIMLWFDSKYKSKASYSVAQLIRLMILVDRLKGDDRYRNHVQKLGSFLLSLQSVNDDISTNGGFYEEMYSSLFGWKKRLRINSWGSMFALQALYWKENYANLSFENSIKYIF